LLAEESLHPPKGLCLHSTTDFPAPSKTEATGGMDLVAPICSTRCSSHPSRGCRGCVAAVRLLPLVQSPASTGM